MTIERKTYTVEYWTCDKGHKHKTRKAAEKCVAGGINAKKRKAEAAKKRAEKLGTYKSNVGRNAALIEKWLECGSYAESARTFGISGSRARELISNLRRLTEYMDFRKKYAPGSPFSSIEGVAKHTGYSMDLVIRMKEKTDKILSEDKE